MCVIIHKPAGVSIPDDDLISASIVNKDGFGLMYKDKGKVVVEKTLNPEIEIVLKRLDELQDREVLMHFRFTTVGSTCLNQCHPFQVTRQTAKRPSVYMMHNGTFSSVPVKEGENDSMAFAKRLIKPLLLQDYMQLYDEQWQKWIDSMAGWSKLAFMDSEGVVVRTGDWVTRDSTNKDVLYHASNAYSFNRTHRTPKTKNKIGFNMNTGQDTDLGYGGGSGRNYYEEMYGGWDAQGRYSETYSSGSHLKVVDSTKVEDEFVQYLFDIEDSLSTMSLAEIVVWVTEDPTLTYDYITEMYGIGYIEGLSAESTLTDEGEDVLAWIGIAPQEVAALIYEGDPL